MSLYQKLVREYNLGIIPIEEPPRKESMSYHTIGYCVWHICTYENIDIENSILSDSEMKHMGLVAMFNNTGILKQIEEKSQYDCFSCKKKFNADIIRNLFVQYSIK